jgi:hypothetical protein
MTADHITALYRWFLGVTPTKEEMLHAAVHVTTDTKHNCYLQVDKRMFNEKEPARKHLLVYSSCHCEQIGVYLEKYRPDVLDDCYLHMLFTHRMDCNREVSNNRLVWSMFANADLIIWNVLDAKFGQRSTEVLGKHCKPDVKIVSFVPPSCACWWPVTEFHGEQPVESAVDEGQSLDEIIANFSAGKLNYHYSYRFESQIARLAHRECNRDVGLSDYVMRHYKTHRMFFTFNHPSFHVISYLADQCLGKLGFKMLGEGHSLTVGVNEANMGNHYPDHPSMWEFYGFEYPMDLARERGGWQLYYPQVIREAANRYAARNHQPAYDDLESDY